ncbi:MAG: hypothetical protein ACRECN_00220, partial [Methylocella sp.]
VMEYAHQGVELKPLPGRPAPVMPPPPAAGTRRPASLSAAAATALADIETAMTNMQKQRGDAGIAANSLAGGGTGRDNPAAAGNATAGGGG